MKIQKTYCNKEREALKSAFGFKGNSLTYLQQTAVAVYDGDEVGVGVGVQSVLWSDASIFASYGEDKGNELMYRITEYGAKIIVGREFNDPYEASSFLIEECYAYAKAICGEGVSQTFVLNALVPIDFALWMLYAKENGIGSFDSVLYPMEKHTRLANIPLVTYNTSVPEVVETAKRGTPIFKIKIGADPDKDGDPEKMLKADMARALELHSALENIETEFTESGHIVYYFDANGRYDTKDRLRRFISFLDEHGILERCVLFEEPFDEKNEIYVGDLPCIFAADESIHNISDVEKRIKLGYKAITLKSIAKTLTFSLKTEEYARKAGVQCFCADLTVNPVMLEWNINFASRLNSIKGMKIGVVESNGAQNYVNWEEMRTYLPKDNLDLSDAVYKLDNGFYSDPGIFTEPIHYLNLALKGRINEK